MSEFRACHHENPDPFTSILLMVSEYDPTHRIVSIFSDSVHTSTTPGSSTNPSWGEQLGMEDDPLEARLSGVEHYRVDGVKWVVGQREAHCTSLVTHRRGLKRRRL